MPLIFTFLWSTGWIVAGYSARYADALTFLAVRFATAAALVTLMALAAGAPWPRSRRAVIDIAITGILLHGVYLAGVWWAVRHGLPAGISGLIAGLQPILTALFAPALVGERISGIRWLGIACGFIGIALVLEPQLAGVDPAALWGVLLPILINVIGMFAVTGGSFYQKAHVVSGDLRTMTAIQYTAAFLVTIPFAWALEPMRIEWVSGISLCASTFRRGAARLSRRDSGARSASGTSRQAGVPLSSWRRAESAAWRLIVSATPGSSTAPCGEVSACATMRSSSGSRAMTSSSRTGP